MKRLFLIALAICALLFLVACRNENQSDTAQIDDDEVLNEGEVLDDIAPTNDIPPVSDWVRNFFTEEEIASGEMLTISVNGDYAAFHTLEDLLYYSSTTDIVKAVVLDERVEWVDTTLPIPEEWGINIEYIPPSGQPNTLTRIQVLEVFHGEATVDDTIEVIQRGGQIGNFTLENRNLINFAIGDVYVFFLCRIELPEWFDGEFLPTFDYFPMYFPNPWQAVYRLPSERLMSDSSYEDLENINYISGNFTLELGDLVQLWVYNLSSVTELDTAIGDIQVSTTDGEVYTLDELSHMPYEEAISLDLTQESLQAILDSGAVLAG